MYRSKRKPIFTTADIFLGFIFLSFLIPIKNWPKFVFIRDRWTEGQTLTYTNCTVYILLKLTHGLASQTTPLLFFKVFWVWASAEALAIYNSQQFFLNILGYLKSQVLDDNNSYMKENSSKTCLWQTVFSFCFKQDKLRRLTVMWETEDSPRIHWHFNSGRLPLSPLGPPSRSAAINAII